jgi:phosphoribosylformylglycinamidine synthase
VISGNVSFYNETNDISIYPTPIIGMAGILEDASKRMTQYFRDEGDVILLIGRNSDEIGLSEYLKEIHYKVRGLPPRLDLELEKKVQDLCLYGIKEGIIKSAHDTSEGGLAVALGECCISSGERGVIGAEIDLMDDIRPDALLFGETQSRIIITVGEDKAAGIERAGEERDVPVKIIGRVGGERLVVRHRSEALVDLSLQDIKEAWGQAIPQSLGEVEE